MSDADIDAINKELEGKLEGVNVDEIAEHQLGKLDKDYQLTIAATMNPIEVFQDSISSDHEWEADFSNDYQQCPSDDEDEEEAEEPQEPVYVPQKRDIELTQENVEKIKEIMGKIHLKPAPWAALVPEERMHDYLKSKLINLLTDNAL